MESRVIDQIRKICVEERYALDTLLLMESHAIYKVREMFNCGRTGFMGNCIYNGIMCYIAGRREV